MSDDFDLFRRFPDMRPLTRPPSLFTLNGIGTIAYGQRDHDDETGTYVKTVSFCVLFIPLVFLSAYRVADAPGGGWYFLGRVPLAGIARGWNWLVLALVLVGGGAGVYSSYTGTAEYRASRKLAEADQTAADGQSSRAAELYREVMAIPSPHAGTAGQRLQDLPESASPAEAPGVFRVLLDLHRQNRLRMPDLFDRAAKLAQAHGDSDPKAALELLEVVAPLAPKPQDHLAPRRKLLEKLVEQQPLDSGLACRLAVLYAELGERDRCEKLLLPHEKNLGDHEAAAILGAIHVSRGRQEKAVALLEPFVRARLPRLQQAQSQLKASETAASQRAVVQLKGGLAPGFDYNRYKTANDAERQQMVDEFVSGQTLNDPGIKAARQAVRENAAVVSATLDLGLAQLQLAQAIPDPAKRKDRLEQAEKTLLGVSGVAGESDRYRLNLGQVYYWLGKHTEGRKLFDELMERQKRSTGILITVASVLRNVGAVSDARQLAEEAYKQEKNTAARQRVAQFRSVMWTDLDDQIAWLSRGDPMDAEVRASLAVCQGTKASQDGKDELAAKHYRDALEIYAGMPENPATLNNSALAHMALFAVSGEREQLQRASDKFDRALTLQPGDTILMDNAADLLQSNAIRDVIGDAIDLKLLKSSAGADLLSYLYADAAGKARLVEQIRKHPGLVKAQGRLERLLVLAPKRAGVYSQLAGWYSLWRDEKRLVDLRDRLTRIELDQIGERKEMLDFLTGKNDAKTRETLKKTLARREALLPAARKAGGTTLAVAACNIVQSRISKASMQDRVDADDLVRLAEEAEKAAPSEGTKNTLASALLFRAHQRLATADAGYRELAEKTVRSLGAFLVYHALTEEGPWRDRVSKDADVERAMQLCLDRLKRFPDERSPRDWALLVARHPEEAEAVAARVRTDRVGALKRQIDLKVSPLSATATLQQAWALRIAGKKDEADALVRKCKEQGVPLP